MFLNEKELRTVVSKCNNIVNHDISNIVNSLSNLIFNEVKNLNSVQKEKIIDSVKESICITSSGAIYIEKVLELIEAVSNLEKIIICEKPMKLNDLYNMINCYQNFKEIRGEKLECTHEIYAVYECIQNETDLNLPLNLVFEFEEILNKEINNSINRLVNFVEKYFASFEKYTELNKNIYFEGENSIESLEKICKDIHEDLDSNYSYPMYIKYKSVPVTSRNYYNHFIKVVLQIYMNYFNLKNKMEYESDKFKNNGNHLVNIYEAFRNDLSECEKKECLGLIGCTKKYYDEALIDEKIREQLALEKLDMLMNYDEKDITFFENNNLYKILISMPLEMLENNKSLLNNILDGYIIYLDNKLSKSNDKEELENTYVEIVDFINQIEYNLYYSRYYFFKLCELIKDSKNSLNSIELEIPDDIKYELGIETDYKARKQ